MLCASTTGCASGTVTDDPFEHGDAGESVQAANPGPVGGDSSLGVLVADAGLAGAHVSTGATGGGGDAAAPHTQLADASAPPASTSTPTSSGTTNTATRPPPATTPATGGTTSSGKPDASTPADAATSPPRTPPTNPTTPPANAAKCESDDDCVETNCLPIGVIGCCRLDGVCGCTWSAAYCL